MKLNISKCKIVSFGRHVDKNYVYNIKENNQITQLEYEERYKDLEVTFDSDLETRVRGQSRSSKVIPFNPAPMTSY